ncbi:MAG: hydrogenase 4 subunit B, partial [Actinobacteria bacterium]|nr:hydrogenase 4 subunit B [Actinomycetota bacterium]
IRASKWVSVSDGLGFLVVWELMTLVSYLLVAAGSAGDEGRNAGFVYIVMTHVGTAFITLAFLILFGATGSFDFAAWRLAGPSLSPAVRNWAFVLAFIGFGTKAGIVPLHVWLPRAHPAAPSNVSALMSGVMIKTAIYGLVRMSLEFLGPVPAWWGPAVLAFALVSSLLGVIYALMEHDLKRLLAYHSVENIGIILLGLGAALTLVSLGHRGLAALALVAGLYHLINHAAFKGLLFLGAGSVLYSTHTKDVEKLGGLIKRMPWTAFLFLIGSISISALPPFNGFVSEWLTMRSLLALAGPGAGTGLKISAPVAAALLGLTGALAAACFVKAFGITFLAQPRSQKAAHAAEVPAPMNAGAGLLGLACLVLGLFPGRVMALLNVAAAPIIGAGIPAGTSVFGGLSAVPPVAAGAGSLSLSPLGIAVALAALLGVSVAVPAMIGGRTRVRVDETWNCGVTLKPRMEYTATSFSKPLRQVFRFLLRPTRHVERGEGVRPHLAGAIRYHSAVKPIFEDYLYRPFSRTVVYVSDRLRALQTGSIQIYLAYILATLIVLLTLAR